MTTTSATGSITSTGIGSGLDVSSIVAKLMSIESQPLTLLQNTASSLNSTLSAVGQLKSLTSTMRDAASGLTSLDLWNSTKSSSTDGTVVSASTADGAAVGNYSVTVSALASSQTVSSQAYGSSTSTVGEGTLSLKVGSNAAVDVSVAATDTLADIRDKINASGAGVSATIINDATGARLAFTSKDTGTANAFTVTGTETASNSPGLAALTYDPNSSASVMALNQSAGDAKARINGIDITSSSNTLDGVADGLTLTLQKTTTSAVTVAVTADNDAVTAAVNKFVSAYNGLMNYIKTQTKYDPTSKTAGTLQGDFTTVGEQAQMRGVSNQQFDGSSMYKTLSDVGITLGADGTMSVDSTKLTNALTHREDVRQLFMANGSTAGTQGFMTRFRELGDSLLDTDGSLTTRTNSLNAMLETNSDDQARMQDRLDQTQARLERQYQALDTLMAQLSSTSSYLTQQLTALSKTA